MFKELLARVDWRRDAVLWGRVLAAAVVVLGIVAAAMNAGDLQEAARLGDFARLRWFIAFVLGYVWYGGLILIVAEFVARLRNERPLWRAARLVRAMGASIIGAGLLVSIWTAIELSDAQAGRPAFSASDSLRYILGASVGSYLWQGTILILLAAVADYSGWRGDEEIPEEEEASIVVTEP